jgi:hypothetical protein
MTTAAFAAYERGAVRGNAEPRVTEETMRITIALLGLGALVAGAFVYPAAAGKTKMGCEVGKEHWDAKVGKCVAGAAEKKSAKKKG